MNTKRYYGAGSVPDGKGEYPKPISYWALVANLGLSSVRAKISPEVLAELDELIEKRDL